MAYSNAFQNFLGAARRRSDIAVDSGELTLWPQGRWEWVPEGADLDASDDLGVIFELALFSDRQDLLTEVASYDAQ